MNKVIQKQSVQLLEEDGVYHEPYIMDLVIQLDILFCHKSIFLVISCVNQN